MTLDSSHAEVKDEFVIRCLTGYCGGTLATARPRLLSWARVFDAFTRSQPLSSMTIGMDHHGVTRQLSVKSTGLAHLTTSNDSYFVPVNKLPLNLTPSQRLHLRKAQLNSTISKFKQPRIEFESPHDEIDDDIPFFNVPLSQPLVLLAQREKLTFANSLRTSELTRTSVMSSDSTDSFFNKSVRTSTSTNSFLSQHDIHDLNSSTDALELTLAFSNSDTVQMAEELSLKKLMLSTICEPIPSPSAYKKNDTADKEINTSSAKNTSSLRLPWLPPKKHHDAAKHRRQSDDIIHRALSQELRLVQHHVNKVQQEARLRLKDEPIWESILPHDVASHEKYTRSVATARVRNMCWRGLPALVSSQVRWLQIGSSAKLTSPAARKLLEAATSVNWPLAERIHQDVVNTYPEVRMFQRQETIELLKHIVIAFLLHKGKSPDQYYFTGLSNVAALLLHSFNNPAMVVMALTNIYDSPTMQGLFLVRSGHGGSPILTAIDTCLRTANPRLHTHFKVVGLHPSEYLPSLLLSIFTGSLTFELSNRLLDIWIFEKDSFLERCVVALLSKVSHKLYGSKPEVLAVLGESSRYTRNSSTDVYRYLNVGYDHEFVESIRAI